MKNIFTLSFLLSFLVCSFSQGTWVQKSNFGGSKRYSAIGFSIGSKGYIGTGSSNNFSVLYNDFWEWDQATDTWTQKANFPGAARFYAVDFSIASKGYIGTGSDVNSTLYKDFWEYDPALNTWTQKANFGGTARLGATGFTIGNKGYIGFGMDAFTPTYQNDLWEYDALSNTWLQKVNCPFTPRGFAKGFSIGNKAYVGTGSAGNPNTVLYKDFWEYDAVINTWTQKADFADTARDDAIGFSIGNFGYIGCGDSVNLTASYTTSFSDFWQYDPATNSWVQMANYGGGITAAASSFVIGCKGYVGTGWMFPNSSTVKNDLWEFSPPALTHTFSISNVDCFGSNTGSAVVNVSNGTPSYTYLWNSIPVQQPKQQAGFMQALILSQ